jgi:hypothetical protein
VQEQKLRSFATNRSEAELGEAKSRLGGAKSMTNSLPKLSVLAAGFYYFGILLFKAI